VTDLPFKNLKPQWHGDEYDPHCLTRWFDEDWFGHYMNPEAMEDIMTSETYADFFLAVEMGPHDIIPMGIRGDFTSFTAPNGTTHCFRDMFMAELPLDTLFPLHHSPQNKHQSLRR
jgi:hypothetical protein